MIAAILAFLLKRPALVGLAALAIALGVTDLRLHHANGDLAALRKADAASLAEAAQRQKAASAISTDARTESASARVQIVTRYRTLAAKADELGPEMDRDCVIPKAWV